jgi:ribonuclease-3
MLPKPSIPRTLMNPLEERIGYKFRNSLLLAEALTHSSISLERKNYPFDNQRLEFLGDAVLQLVVTEYLYSIFPDFPEGVLTKLRTRIVSRAGLKNHAAALGLGSHLMMGRGEDASGGRTRASTLADAFESIVGAMYLDGGYNVVRDFILRETAADFLQIAAKPVEINPKGLLQELLQAITPNAPVYEVITQTGPEHQKNFECRVMWEKLELARGAGRSKKQAEVEAATAALEARKWEARTSTPSRKPRNVVNKAQEGGGTPLPTRPQQ